MNLQRICHAINSIRDKYGERVRTGFEREEPEFTVKIHELITKSKTYLGNQFSSNEFFALRELRQELERRSFEKVPIPDEFLEMITVFNREAMECLEKSQAQFDAWKRNHTMKQIILFLWRALFIRFLQMIDADYRQRFSLYGTLLWKKDHAKDVLNQDISKKKQAFHEMLKSWTHLIPPQIEDIIFPDSHLQNAMLMEEGSEWWGIPPVTGFVEPPTLKPDAVRLSISDYISNECADAKETDDINEYDYHIRNFILHTIDPDYFDYDPFKEDPRFLSDLMERYGLTFYLQICRMFPGLISEFHPTK